MTPRPLIDEKIRAHRPTDEDLMTMWPEEERDTLWAGLEEKLTGSTSVQPSRAPRRTRRWFLAGAAAAALAVTVTIAPSVLAPQSTPSAQAVQQLVAAAEESDPAVIPDGRYLHMVVRDEQINADPSLPRMWQVQESWIGADGRTWRKDLRGGQDAEFFLFSAPPSAGSLDLTPAGVTAMPADPDALFDLLDSSVEGSSSHHEAIFRAVGDMARLGYVPADVQAAAIQVAAGLPEVTAHAAGGLTTLSFVDAQIRPGVKTSLVFDSVTAVLVSEQVTSSLPRHGFDYTASFEILGIVDELPSEVRAGAEPVGAEPVQVGAG